MVAWIIMPLDPDLHQRQVMQWWQLARNAMSRGIADRMAFLRLDAAHDGREAFIAYGLRGHPSFVIIDNVGDVLWKSVGDQSRSPLETAIRQALGKE
jgi:hypothetical protein